MGDVGLRIYSRFENPKIGWLPHYFRGGLDEDGEVHDF